MNTTYDILIVGSGLGGLASAVILAKEGYSVCVLEKNNQFGGNLQTFVRDKTIFDTGVHYIGGLDKGQNLYRYFDYLGILPEIKLSRMDLDAYDYISFGDDEKAYPHAQGYANFSAQLATYFPDERDAIEKYCAKIQEVCASFPLYNLEEGAPYDLKVLTLNLKDYLDSITGNEQLKAVLVGSNLLYVGDGATTPFYVHALSVNSYIQSAWRCIRGGSQISKALVKQLRKYGGTIFRRTEVRSFVYEKEQLIGVKTTDGTIFKAQQFISNIDLNATIRLAGDVIYKKPFRKRVENLKDTPSSFSIHLVFKPNSFPYLNHNIYHFKSLDDVWTAHESDRENWPKVFMASMGLSEENPSYAESMSVMTYMDFDWVKEWENTVNTVVDENDRGEAYEQFKAHYTEILLQEVERKFPTIRESIHSIHATTPLTYRDYIGGRGGNMYGFRKDAAEPMKTFISPRTKIPNLFVTGQSVNMHGLMGVTIGAVNTCSEIIGRTALLQKINSKNT